MSNDHQSPQLSVGYLSNGARRALFALDTGQLTEQWRPAGWMPVTYCDTNGAIYRGGGVAALLAIAFAERATEAGRTVIRLAAAGRRALDQYRPHRRRGSAEEAAA